MRISHIRLGRETNSSSSHCFVNIPAEKEPTWLSESAISTGYYGWEWDLITDRDKLLSYLVTQAVQVMPKGCLFDLSYLLEQPITISPSDGIDYQATFNFTGKPFIMASFFRDIIREIGNSRIGIITGNDNDDCPEWVYTSLEPKKEIRPDLVMVEEPKAVRDCKWNILFEESIVSCPSHGTYVLLLRPQSNFWKLWDSERRVGRWVKVRLEMGELEMEEKTRPDYLESILNYPESIDVKITEKCNNDCSFCSESSGSNGQHCDVAEFEQLIDDISGHTAEIAIGGGNPLLHPQLFDMLEYAIDNYVLPAITVKDTDLLGFLTNMVWARRMHRIFRNTAIGISFSNIEAMKNIADLIHRIPWPFPEVVVHVINRVHTMGNVHAIKEYGFPLLVLGFKDKGRGQTYKQVADMDVESLLKLEYISFDTLAVEQLGVRDHVGEKTWEYCFGGWDGEHSMYVDLVKQTYGKSSYAAQHDIRKNFRIQESFSNLT